MTVLVSALYPNLSERRHSILFFDANVPAGFPSPADDYKEEPLNLHDYVTRNPSATFFVKASGDSMQGAGIHDQDILVVDRSITPSPGKVVVAAVNGELVVKRLLRNGDCLILAPENENYEAIELLEGCEFQVWGVVTYVVHTIR